MLMETWPASPTHPAGAMRIPEVVEGYKAGLAQFATAV
jgi:hypothetical protein